MTAQTLTLVPDRSSDTASTPSNRHCSLIPGILVKPFEWPVAENDNDRLVPFPAVWGQQAKTSLEGRSRRF